MGKFIKVANKKTMVKVEIDGNETWANTTKAVKEFADKNFKKGDTVNIQYEEKGDGLPFVTRIEKGSGSDSSSKKTDTPKKNVCSDCGKELKDSKYEKCYTCNKKNPSKKTNTDSQDAINRQNANHATSRALIAMQGQVDPNNVLELIDTLHAKFMEKITG